MTRHPTIAGVVLTLNEEQNIPRALGSLSWCDELLVVDSGSTDRTQLVAEDFGARFQQHIQKPPFRITDQRNWALQHSGVKSDWVLFLDADEAATPQLAQQILACIKSPLSHDAYQLTPRYFFLGKWLKRTQGFPNWHPRLVRRGKAYFEGGVWETFSKNASVGYIDEPYDHFAFSKGFDDWLERHQRYAHWDADRTLEYICTSDIKSLQTHRKYRLRAVMARLWFLRPPLRFIQKYIINGGLIEGWQAFVFSMMMFFYDFMVVVLIIEKRRLLQRLPL